MQNKFDWAEAARQARPILKVARTSLLAVWQAREGGTISKVLAAGTIASEVAEGFFWREPSTIQISRLGLSYRCYLVGPFFKTCFEDPTPTRILEDAGYGSGKAYVWYADGVPAYAIVDDARGVHLYTRSNIEPVRRHFKRLWANGDLHLTASKDGTELHVIGESGAVRCKKGG